MRLLGIAVAITAGLALAGLALLNATRHGPTLAQQPVVAAPERPLVFVPGLLGSMLCRTGPDGEEVVAWGNVDALGSFPSLAVTETNDIEPCGLIREVSFLGIFTQTVYAPFIDRLTAAGYEEGKTLFVFDYDWRLSVLDNAKRLAEFVEAEIPGGQTIDVVTHSMGGLIARAYALNEGGDARIARLVSAGTPWRGSVQVFELLHDGWGFANALLGGIEAFRRTVVSFPSTFELLPQYEGCCEADLPEVTGADILSADAWAALKWPGIETSALPDFATIRARQAKLRAILNAPLPATIEEAFVIGVDQRTPEQYELEAGEGEAQLTVRTSWEGDGTVLRDSARPFERITYPTSFATHDAILNDEAVQDFVLAALTDGPGAAIRSVPVRERTSILTALGELVTLIGVAVTTDAPVYATGSTATVVVHVRPEVMEPIDIATLSLTVTPPGGATQLVTLAADPGESDPSNPFEQSFSALVETGGQAGELVLTLTVNEGAPDARTVTRVVPVLAP